MISMALTTFQDRGDHLLRRVLALPSGDLDGTYEWLGGRFGVRHGVYRVSEELQAEADKLAPDGSRTGRLAAWPAAAIWDLVAVLLPLDDATFDADPGGGEWSLRQTMAHVNASQDFWSWLVSWTLQQVEAGEAPQPRPQRAEIPERLLVSEDVFEGTVQEARSELRVMLAEGLGAIGRLEELGALDVEVKFNVRHDLVPVSYYPRRWGAHLREHTTQLDKTLAMLRRPPTEQERLAREVSHGLGELEAAWWRAGRPGDLDGALGPAETALAAVEQSVAVG